MTTPDVGLLHGRLTQHLTDIDQLREDVATTLATLSGEAASDWNAGQLAELWAAIAELHLAREIVGVLAAFPERWHAFVNLITETDRLQARNELGHLRRAVKRIRQGRDVPLFERGQRRETAYLQAYRMSEGVAALLRPIIEETS